MARLTTSVRIAATSILLLSFVHIAFWAILAITLRSELSMEFPYNYFFPIFCILSGAGLLGVLVAAGLLYARNWARIAALALAALVAFFCALAMVLSIALIFGPVAAGLGVDVHVSSKSDFVRLALAYLFVFSLSVWWIFLFSRKSVAVQFSPDSASAAVTPVSLKKPSCPPPIALLAWLMIISSALSALSWPLILGKIPAMLFTHIYSMPASKWIWLANILIFLVCGIGLLELWRWSYSATIGVHVFWLVSLFVSQLSPSYEKYLGDCLTAFGDAYTFYHVRINSPQWVSALLTTIPTALLIAGLFYYRRSFLDAVESSKHLSE